MEYATYQTTPEIHGEGTFFLLTADIRCIQTGIKRRTMAVCARDVLVRENDNTLSSWIRRRK